VRAGQHAGRVQRKREDERRERPHHWGRTGRAWVLISTRASLFFPLSLLALLDSSPLSLPSFNFSFLPSSTCILFSHCYSSLPTEFPLYPPSVTDSPAPLHHLAHLTSRPEPIFSLVLFLLYIRIPPSSPYPSSLTHTHTYTNHVSYHGARERGGGRAPLEWQVKFFYFFFLFLSFLRSSTLISSAVRCWLLDCSRPGLALCPLTRPCSQKRGMCIHPTTARPRLRPQQTTQPQTTLSVGPLPVFLSSPPCDRACHLSRGAKRDFSKRLTSSRRCLNPVLNS